MIFFITLFIIFIFLLPIPIKITIHYSNSNYSIKFYRFIIFSKDGGPLNELLLKFSQKETTPPKTSNTNTKENNKTNKKKLSIKNLYKRIRHNKFKPTISFKGIIHYSLSDAFLDSISYGLFCNLNIIFYALFSVLFKVKNCNFNFKPQFKDKILVNITITSIITFNLVKIIYMLFLMAKSRIYIQEVNP